MLQPKRTKFRKCQKGRNRGLALRGQPCELREYGLKAIGAAGSRRGRSRPAAAP